MLRMICLALIVLNSRTMVSAAEKPSIEVLTLLADQYVRINGRVVVSEVDLYEVENLWETMQTQILKVRLRPIFGGAGTMPETDYLLYHDGALQPMGSLSEWSSRQLNGTLSENGLLSAVVVDGRLYYSYSYFIGSGAYLVSFVGQVTSQDGRLSFLESECPYKVLLAEVDGRVRVRSGHFDNFDSRTEITPIGWLKLETTQFADLPRLVIVDDFGEKFDYQKFDYHYPYEFGWVNARSRWIVIPEHVGDEIAARFKIETPGQFGKIQSTLFPAACRPIEISDDSAEFATDVDQPLGECSPRECWISLAGDGEGPISALFRIHE